MLLSHMQTKHIRDRIVPFVPLTQSVMKLAILAVAKLVLPLSLLVMPLRQCPAQAAAPSCWPESEIREKLYLKSSENFKATTLGPCIFRIEGVTPIGSEHEPKRITGRVPFRFDAQFLAGKPPRYIAVYALGFEEERGGCYSAPCTFDPKGRVLKEAVTVAAAEAEAAKLVAAAKVAGKP